jgi:hypothetical protein
MRTFFLLFALAALAASGCGGRREPEKRQAPATDGTSLGDLLTLDAAPGSGTPAAGRTAPAAPPEAPPVAAPGDGVSSDSPRCQKARADYKAKRAEVDALRATLVEPDEKTMLAAQAVYSNCAKNPTDCEADAKKVLEMQQKANASVSRYQATVRKVAEAEAGLYPFDQAVDRACNQE